MRARTAAGHVDQRRTLRPRRAVRAHSFRADAPLARRAEVARGCPDGRRQLAVGARDTALAVGRGSSNRARGARASIAKEGLARRANPRDPLDPCGSVRLDPLARNEAEDRGLRRARPPARSDFCDHRKLRGGVARHPVDHVVRLRVHRLQPGPHQLLQVGVKGRPILWDGSATPHELHRLVLADAKHARAEEEESSARLSRPEHPRGVAGPSDRKAVCAA